METRWYFLEKGQQRGPLSSDELANLTASGRLRPSDLVWREGMAQWVAASSVTGLFSTGPAPCTSSGAPVPPQVGDRPRAGSEDVGVLPATAPEGVRRTVLIWVVLAVVFVWVLIPLTAWVIQTRQSTASGVPIEKTGHEALTALDREAARQAMDRWPVTEVGDSQYIFEGSSDELYELREPTVMVIAKPLTEADKLNGITWRGEVALGAKAVRTFGLRHNKHGKPEKVWTQWTPKDWRWWGPEGALINSARVSRTDNIWHVALNDVLNMPPAFRKPDPSEIPAASPN